MKRRDLLKALPVAGVVISTGAVAAPAASLDEVIDHHQRELRRLLAERHGIGGWRMMATSHRGISGPMETFGIPEADA